VLLRQLRCHLPSTLAILLIVTIAYIALHSAASHSRAGFGLATDLVIAVGLASLAAGTIVITAVTIQRRRAAAGACHACSHPCRGAMVPSPEIDTRRWPHRPLSQDVLPLTVVSSQLRIQPKHAGAPGAEVTVARAKHEPVRTNSLTAVRAEPGPNGGGRSPYRLYASGTR
jgi:hypothetical protein